MMHVKLDMDKIYDKLVAQVEKYNQIDFDAIVPKILDEAADVMLEVMQKEVVKHKRKGRAMSALKKTEVEQFGNYFSIKVGAPDIRGEDKAGFHIIYHEHGSPGHMPKRKANPQSRYKRKGTIAGVLKATPFLKKAQAKGKAEVLRIAGEILQREVKG